MTRALLFFFRCCSVLGAWCPHSCRLRSTGANCWLDGRRPSPHELTVSAGAIGHTSFHTDPTGRTTPSLGYSELLEYVTCRISAADTFSLMLHTVETGTRYLSPDGGIPYQAVRGWVVTNGEIRALSGQEVWEASCRDSTSPLPLDPEAGIHYVDADDIPRPYPW